MSKTSRPRSSPLERRVFLFEILAVHAFVSWDLSFLRIMD